MTDKVIENNQVTIMGEVVGEFAFSHEIFGEGFYMIDVEVARLSESFDVIPVMVSERLLDVNLAVGERIAVAGRIQSREYMKKISEDMTEKRVAYEVSVSKLELAQEEE